VAVVENSVQIARTPQEVFDYFADPRNELDWKPSVELMEKITDGPIGVGTKFRVKWTRGKAVTMTCVTYEPGVSWCFANDGPVSVEQTTSLVAHEGGTTLTSRLEVHPNGAYRLVFPMIVMAMRREEARNMGRMKQAVESR
jgi:uncharacterized protein YndB with AHSA1/START domain